MSKSIRTRIRCENLAPFKSLDSELTTNTLRIGIFANNGSGKTFLSRMFRLLEGNKITVTDGICSTDYLIRFGSNKAFFSWQISDESGDKEDVQININRSQCPIIPQTYYIYHTFTYDYVEENIRALNFEKDSNITGFILGKANIDLSEDEKRLKLITEQGSALKDEISQFVENFKQEKLGSIPLSRLQEYKFYLDLKYILDSDKYTQSPDIKSFESAIEAYNKVKAIPENLLDVPSLLYPNVNFDIIEEIIQILAFEYSVTKVADDFKNKIRNKEIFIESGLKFNVNKECPFCGQQYSDSALALIDSYVAYFNNNETKAIKNIRIIIEHLKSIHSELSSLKDKAERQRAIFDKYKHDYIPSFENQELQPIQIENIVHIFTQLSSLLENKIKALNIPIVLDCDVINKLSEEIAQLKSLINANNVTVRRINDRKGKISNENLATRREICKSASVHICMCLREKILKRKQLLQEYTKLQADINKKRETEKTSKKEIVAETIRRVLDYFFVGKYTLNSDNFQLIFNSRELEKGQTGKVLSEGEKSIIAFAYYLGDAHIKINKDEDYQRLFFIIDDPISSMDFTYVYTMSGVIREIQNIIPKIGNKYRFIVLTHNNDFMRILKENKIISNALLLSDDEIEPLNVNFAVPYISHLIDIYKVARCGAKATHTTPNSIRHIIETLTKFHSIQVSDDSIAEYIKQYIPMDKKTYTLINDLSHGGWRSEQSPMTNKDYQEVCEEVIRHIESIFPKQIEYCSKHC